MPVSRESIHDKYSRELSQYPPFSNVEMLWHFQWLERASGPARDQIHATLVAHNLRLVFKWAKHFRFQGFKAGLTFMDLIQEGSIGLWYAVDAYDWRRDSAFSTVADFWIRRDIADAVKGSISDGMPRIPAYAHDQQAKVYNAIVQLENKGVDPTPYAVYCVIKADEEKKGKKKKKGKRRAVLSLRDVGHALKRLRRRADPLDKPASLRSGQGATLHDRLEDEQPLPADVLASARHVHGQLSDVLLMVENTISAQSERDCRILASRLGFFGKVVTCRKLAKRIGLSRSRINQIETQSLVLLRGQTGFSGREIRWMISMHRELAGLVIANT